MKIRDTLIISLAIIAAGYMVADSLKPAQAIGDGDYSMVMHKGSQHVWILSDDGDVKICRQGLNQEKQLDRRMQPVCTKWSN